jgi:hypothetical protein
LYGALQQEPTYIDDLLLSILKENRNDKTYFVFNFGSLPGIYTVLLDQHNGLKPSS